MCVLKIAHLNPINYCQSRFSHRSIFGYWAEDVIIISCCPLILNNAEYDAVQVHFSEAVTPRLKAGVMGGLL